MARELLTTVAAEVENVSEAAGSEFRRASGVKNTTAAPGAGTVTGQTLLAVSQLTVNDWMSPIRRPSET